ncbi:GNAT family N-acetyltransferase [Streptomyces sp. SID8379]|uniref:GNAT family N-acetyltransferase n=1 Tax=unclassified Streptomyces TaxID=2593676 RepID=UPI00035C4190|nr:MULTISPECIES: GNAT family N-acetyltransferase [unclassified Streptomyces]MYW62627.1 GNAT family N-acetyltransferase [Streptomyces sp. SID8379]
MIELQPRELPALARWFPAGTPGPAAVGEHALRTGNGRWWADRPVQPRALAVSCADHVMLRGTPDDLTPKDLGPLAHSYIDAPARFHPLLAAAFTTLTPWERMVWTHQAPSTPSSLPRGMTVRRIEPADTNVLHTLGPDSAWITASWGGPLGLAASGHGWIATDRTGTALAIACAYFRGSRYEDVAVLTRPDHRRHRLALACVSALCDDITARGHTPSWNCSTLNRASRLLAWTAGFRLVHEYVHYASGSPAQQELLTA